MSVLAFQWNTNANNCKMQNALMHVNDTAQLFHEDATSQKRNVDIQNACAQNNALSLLTDEGSWKVAAGCCLLACTCTELESIVAWYLVMLQTMVSQQLHMCTHPPAPST